jgi:hypothetical protein
VGWPQYLCGFVVGQVLWVALNLVRELFRERGHQTAARTPRARFSGRSSLATRGSCPP